MKLRHLKKNKLFLLPVLFILVVTSLVYAYDPSIFRKDLVKSREANLIFKIPPDYYTEYKPKSKFQDSEITNINNGPTGLKDNWMSIQISKNHNCKVTLPDIPFFVPKYINVAGKWPMLISKSHGRYGSRDHTGHACLDNNKSMIMYRYVKNDGNEAEAIFDQILETAVHRSF